jgi:hypothetical protein
MSSFMLLCIHATVCMLSRGTARVNVTPVGDYAVLKGHIRGLNSAYMYSMVLAECWVPS